MSKEPESRYATAQDLADDLGRFLEHKPIRAKRPTLRERAVKWSRRHPAFLAFGFLLLAVVAVGPGHRLDAPGTEAARGVPAAGPRQRVGRDRRAQRALAEQNARLARQAVDEMFTQVAEKWLADQPKLEPVQREFLEKALHYYEEFSRQDDPRSERSGFRRGRLITCGGHPAPLGIVQAGRGRVSPKPGDRPSLADESPVEPRVSLSARRGTGSNWGIVLLANGKPKDAADAYRRAMETAEALADDASGTRRYRHLLANVHANLGLVQYQTPISYGTPKRNWVRPSLYSRSSSRRILENRPARDSLATHLNNAGKHPPCIEPV